MRLGDGLEIVGLVGMRTHRVRQRRVDRRGAEIGADDGSLGIAAERAHIFQRHLARLHARARNHRAERIENAVLAFAQHLLGQLLIPRSDHVAGEPLRHAWAAAKSRTAAGGGQSGNRAGGLQETAA